MIEGRCTISDEYGQCDADARHKCVSCDAIFCKEHGADIGVRGKRYECHDCIYAIAMEIEKLPPCKCGDRTDDDEVQP